MGPQNAVTERTGAAMGRTVSINGHAMPKMRPWSAVTESAVP
jgi:hypothetical protein